MKIVGLAIVGAVCAAVLKNLAPQIKIPVELATIAAVGVLCAALAAQVARGLGAVESSAEGFLYSGLLLRAAAVSVIGSVSADICRDNGESALAGTVEFASKAAVLIMALPLIEALVSLAVAAARQ